MNLIFNIQNIVDTEIYYGTYCIYILGGHYVETNPDFYVQIINIETNEDIELTEYSLKPRDIKKGRKAIKFYSFEINQYGKFQISVHNFKDIIVKDSILEIFPFPFSIPNKIISFIFGKKSKKIELKNIDILIE